MSEIKSVEEKELLSLLAEGSKLALEHVYVQYFGQLSYYAFKLIRDAEQARDITSDILVNTVNQPKQFKSQLHLKNYLFLAVRHACLHFLGQQKREKSFFDTLYNQAIIAESQPDLEQVRAQVVDAIYKQVELLPKGCAEIFKLVYFEGKSTNEVAEILGISTKTVLNQKKTAAKLLKSALLKKGLLILFVAVFGEL